MNFIRELISIIESHSALPMDNESRMARARKMGFTIRGWHATQSDFEAYDPTAEKVNNISNVAGFYATLYERDVSQYAQEDGSRVLPVLLKAANPFTEGLSPVTEEMVAMFAIEVRKRNRAADERWWNDATAAFKISKSPRSGRQMSFGSEHKIHFDLKPAVQQAILRAGGYDAYIEKTIGGGHRNICVFDPWQIRSVFARFDPSKVMSPNIMD